MPRGQNLKQKKAEYSLTEALEDSEVLKRHLILILAVLLLWYICYGICSNKFGSLILQFVEFVEKQIE